MTECEDKALATKTEPRQDSTPGEEALAAALDRGLDHLVALHDGRTGAWLADRGRKHDDAFLPTRTDIPHVGVTAIALTALLQSEVRLVDGERGRVLAAGTDFLLDAVSRPGGHVRAHGSRMTCHGLATAYLARLHEVTGDEEAWFACLYALDFTVRSQARNGGWRYNPDSLESDVLNTAHQALALCAARDAGLGISGRAMSRALDNVLEHAERPGPVPMRHPTPPLRFHYMPDPHARITPATTAAGLAVLAREGSRLPEDVDAILDPLLEELRASAEQQPDHFKTWYARYFLAITLEELQDDGERIRKIRSCLHLDVLKLQRADGSWPNSTGPGTAFATAVACLVLQS